MALPYTTGLFSGRPVNAVGPAYPMVSRIKGKMREGMMLESRCGELGICYKRRTLTWNQESN